ncbi:hypothetical protein SUGI_0643670 [Cryptomeria japonica]|uniref:probable E3 ubiquitin-protein ligase ATL44 n=1 Tax=Cryptomeria japonica TaxID=3369 RepID=UPI002414C22A|nr:probable E3 ubiquitin-protein ligase ATL44 [Cryptomeria japonica]GLJ31977.1 hypothetical protein SUGI_0643670 [Cryptomeria japonica]
MDMTAIIVLIFFTILFLRLAFDWWKHRNRHQAFFREREREREMVIVLEFLGVSNEGEAAGFSPTEIEQLQSFQFTAKDLNAKTKATKLSCPICLEDFSDGQRFKILPICHHYFHSLCIDKWLALNKNCPCCRLSVTIRALDGNPWELLMRSSEEKCEPQIEHVEAQHETEETITSFSPSAVKHGGHDSSRHETSIAIQKDEDY